MAPVGVALHWPGHSIVAQVPRRINENMLSTLELKLNL